MENSIGERIKQLIEDLKLSNNAFANSIGKSASAVNFMVEGRSKPSFDVLDAICKKYPQVAPAWLLNGEGEMYRSKATPSNAIGAEYLADYLKRLEDQFSRLMNQLESKDRQIEGLQQTVEVLLGKSEGAGVDQLYSAKVIELYPAAQLLG